MSRYLSNFNILAMLATCWFILFLSMYEPFNTLVNYWGFALLGVLGAVFASSTGAGGGVVFVPFFNQLNFDTNTTIATSFAIQCCGMTAGAIAWWLFYRDKQKGNQDWSQLSSALKLTIPFSILGIFAGQFVQFINHGVSDSEQLHVFFGSFSILLSLAIFASIPLLKHRIFRQELLSIDRVLLPIIAMIGGGVTAYLSIGVGELVAVFLVIRKFNVVFSIAVAVILTAFSVWPAIVFHLTFTNAIYWPVVLFAGAGAIVGGSIAKYLVIYISPQNLKIFFASWVFLLGVSALIF